MKFFAYTKIKKKNHNAGEKIKIKDPASGLPTHIGKVPKYSEVFTLLGSVKAKNAKLARKVAHKKWPEAPFIDLYFAEDVKNPETGKFRTRRK